MDDKTNAEFQAESVTLAAVVLVAGFFLLTGHFFDPLGLFLVGIVLLGSAVYQSRRGWHVNLATWVLGVLFTLGGLGMKMFVFFVFQVNWLAIALLAIGGYWLYQLLFRRR